MLFHKHPALTAAAAALTAWIAVCLTVFYVLFVWDWVRYPCYVPNGQFVKTQWNDATARTMSIIL
jgi:hypothetical protein